jgi:hypothetical protein
MAGIQPPSLGDLDPYPATTDAPTTSTPSSVKSPFNLNNSAHQCFKPTNNPLSWRRYLTSSALPEPVRGRDRTVGGREEQVQTLSAFPMDARHAGQSDPRRRPASSVLFTAFNITNGTVTSSRL